MGRIVTCNVWKSGSHLKIQDSLEDGKLLPSRNLSPGRGAPAIISSQFGSIDIILELSTKSRESLGKKYKTLEKVQ